MLTDGTVLLLPDGGEAKAFHTRDGLAVVLAHRAGLRTALLSGRSSEAVSRRARELGIAIVRQGVSDKAAAFAEILAGLGLRPHQAAYIGDDVNDLPAMVQAGLSAAPEDARLRGAGPGLHGDGRPRRPRLLPRVRGGHPAGARRVGVAHGHDRGGAALTPAPGGQAHGERGQRDRRADPR